MGEGRGGGGGEEGAMRKRRGINTYMSVLHTENVARGAN